MASCINPSTWSHTVKPSTESDEFGHGPFLAARHPSRKSDPCRWHLASQVPAAGTNGGYQAGEPKQVGHIPAKYESQHQKKSSSQDSNFLVLLQGFYSGGWTITQNPRLVLDRIRSVHFGAPNWVLHCLPLLCLVPSCAPMAMNIIYWLVVSTPLKNISQLGLLFPILWKNKSHFPNHQPV